MDSLTVGRLHLWGGTNGCFLLSGSTLLTSLRLTEPFRNRSEDIVPSPCVVGRLQALFRPAQFKCVCWVFFLSRV